MAKKTKKYQEIDCSEPIKSWPTVSEMRQFASKFNKIEWIKIAFNEKFRELLMTDLKACGKLAKELLKENK